MHIKKARKDFTKIEGIMSQNPTTIFRMRKEESIRALRKKSGNGKLILVLDFT